MLYIVEQTNVSRGINNQFKTMLINAQQKALYTVRRLIAATKLTLTQCLNCREGGGLNPQLFLRPPNKLADYVLGSKSQKKSTNQICII